MYFNVECVVEGVQITLMSPSAFDPTLKNTSSSVVTERPKLVTPLKGKKSLENLIPTCCLKKEILPIAIFLLRAP